MKLRKNKHYLTPLEKSRPKAAEAVPLKAGRSLTGLKQIIGIALLAVLLVVAFVPTQLASANPYQAEIDSLNEKIAENESVLKDIRGEASTLETKLRSIEAEIGSLSAQIEKTNVEVKQVRKQLKEAEEKLARQKEILAENARTLYKEGDVSTIEVLASSENFSDFVNRQEYLESIKIGIQEAAREVVALTEQLEQKESELQDLIKKLKAQQNVLQGKRNEQATLLAETRGQEARYQEILASQRAERERVQAAQEAAIARLIEGGGGQGQLEFRNLRVYGACGGGYGHDPARNDDYCQYPLDAVVDRWELYNRECVSYTAWAASVRDGKFVAPFGGRGHAYEWPSTTSSYATVNNTPAVGAVAIAGRNMIGGGFGHSMMVEEILGGGWIHISQYNFGGPGMYSEMDVKVDGLVFIHFPGS